MNELETKARELLATEWGTSDWGPCSEITPADVRAVVAGMRWARRDTWLRAAGLAIETADEWSDSQRRFAHGTTPATFSDEERFYRASRCCWASETLRKHAGALTAEAEKELPEADDERRCEGCKAPATCSDSEGIPLCAECAKSLVEEQCPSPASSLDRAALVERARKMSMEPGQQGKWIPELMVDFLLRERAPAPSDRDLVIKCTCGPAAFHEEACPTTVAHRAMAAPAPSEAEVRADERRQALAEVFDLTCEAFREMQATPFVSGDALIGRQYLARIQLAAHPQAGGQELEKPGGAGASACKPEHAQLDSTRCALEAPAGSPAPSSDARAEMVERREELFEKAFEWLTTKCGPMVGANAIAYNCADFALAERAELERENESLKGDKLFLRKERDAAERENAELKSSLAEQEHFHRVNRDGFIAMTARVDGLKQELSEARAALAARTGEAETLERAAEILGRVVGSKGAEDASTVCFYRADRLRAQPAPATTEEDFIVDDGTRKIVPPVAPVSAEADWAEAVGRAWINTDSEDIVGFLRARFGPLVEALRGLASLHATDTPDAAGIAALAKAALSSLRTPAAGPGEGGKQ